MPLIAGRYELGAPIGAGGTATVFRATDHERGIDVALKLVPPGDDSPSLFDRVRREAQLLSQISTRYIPRVYDVGRDETGGVYLALELVTGDALDTAAFGRALMPHEVLKVARALLEGLSAAHEAGIIHLDLKPSNVLVPRSGGVFRAEALSALKIVDFGVARRYARHELAALVGQGSEDGYVWGTPSHMAPEQLAGGEVGPWTDVYAVGLILFDLLGQGPLFEGDGLRARLRARLVSEPALEGRVPPPLSGVLARMLARSPEGRFRDATEAHAAIADLDTAPGVARAHAGVAAELPSGDRPTPTPRSVQVMVEESATLGSGLRAPFLPAVLPSPEIDARLLGSSARAPRLSRLADHAHVALAETLGALDLPMLDALARRERGAKIGRVARSITLALRLEIDAAALILEPLLTDNDVARGVGVSIVAPCARRVTRARVDPDRDAGWIDAVGDELAAIFATFGCALASVQDAARAGLRADQVIPRLEGSLERKNTPALRSALVTTRMARIAASVLAREIPHERAVDEIRALVNEPASRVFDRLLRALFVGVVACYVDDRLARVELERAVRMAQECGATLLEVRASAVLGAVLGETPGRLETALEVLERASTLLVHGDAPLYERVVEYNRGGILLISGRHAEAVPHFQRARAAAKEERFFELELSATASLAIALVCSGDPRSAQEVLADVPQARVGAASPRVGALIRLARCVTTMGDPAAFAGDLREAEVDVTRAGVDARELADLGIVLRAVDRASHGDDVALTEAAHELDHRARELDRASVYWLDVLEAAISQLPSSSRKASLLASRARLHVLTARLRDAERRTSAPPPSEVF